MHTPVELLDSLKATYNLPSDYALAKLISVQRSMISSFRKGRRLPSETLCFKIAELLDFDPVYVWACIKTAKCEDPNMRKVWADAADKLQATA